jgi:hypothetical protein
MFISGQYYNPKRPIMLFFRDKKQQNQPLQESGMMENIRITATQILERVSGFQIKIATSPPDSYRPVNVRQLSPPVNSILLAKVRYDTIPKSV